MTPPKLLLIMPEKRTIEQEVKLLKIYVRIGFVLSAIIFGWLLYERVEHYEQAVRYDDMMNKYLNTLALTDRANELQIANSLRWKHERDSIAALEAKQ